MGAVLPEPADEQRVQHVASDQHGRALCGAKALSLGHRVMRIVWTPVGWTVLGGMGGAFGGALGSVGVGMPGRLVQIASMVTVGAAIAFVAWVMTSAAILSLLRRRDERHAVDAEEQ